MLTRPSPESPVHRSGRPSGEACPCQNVLHLRATQCQILSHARRQVPHRAGPKVRGLKGEGFEGEGSKRHEAVVSDCEGLVHHTFKCRTCVWMEKWVGCFSMDSSLPGQQVTSLECLQVFKCTNPGSAAASLGKCS